MSQTNGDVRRIVEEFLSNKRAFTIFDVIKQLKFDYEKIDMINLRKDLLWCERFYGLEKNSGFYYKLGFEPHLEYVVEKLVEELVLLREELDVDTEKVSMPARCVGVEAVAAPACEYWYAAVDKETGKRLTPIDRTHNQSGLYRNKIGPSQLIAYGHKNTCEIVKYEVLFKQVKS